MRQQPRLVAALEAMVGREHVLTNAEDVEMYSRDALRAARFPDHYHPGELQAQAVVRPRTTEQVSELVKLGRREGVPLVPRGGGTGVMGAAVPLRRGIVVDLARMNRILSVSREDQRATVQPAVVLADLDAALKKHSLILGHDPWSFPVATVGGAISTNGHGYLAGKYGAMGEQVLGLQVVLPTGEVVEFKGLEKVTGPGLKGLFIGAEGAFGILTQVALRVFPSPEQRQLYAFEFPSFAAGFDALLEMRSIGLRPAVLDFSEEVAENSRASRVLVYLGCEGFREEVEAQTKRLLTICRQHGAKDLEQRQATEFWEQRHRSGERYRAEVLGRRRRREDTWNPDYVFDYLHVALPVSKILSYRESCLAIAARHSVHIRDFGFWGSLEMFSMFLAGPGTEGGREAVAQASHEMLTLAQDLGGSMEYCHGVGIRLVHLMERELGAGFQVLKRIKEALDPAGIMNPGKLALM